MVSYRYNRRGELTSITRTDKDYQQKDNPLAVVLVLGLGFLAVIFLPVWAPLLRLYAYLAYTVQIHELFAALIPISLGVTFLFLLWWVWQLRVLYFGLVTIFYSY